MNAPVNTDHESLARSLPLDKLDVSDPALYRDDVWMPYFRRLRREDPVHWQEEEGGPGFTTDDVGTLWLDRLPAGRTFTAERVAYRNLLDARPALASVTRRR